MNKLIVLITALSLWAGPASASFAPNAKRYLSSKDFFSLLTQKFPILTDANQRWTLGESCVFLGKDNSNPVGLINPATGTPASMTPTAGSVRWLGSCVEKVATQQTKIFSNSANEKLWTKYWSQELLNKFRDKNSPHNPYHQFSTLEWRDLTPRQREWQIRFLIEEFIGPNPVIADLGLVKGSDELTAIIAQVLPDDSNLKLNAANVQLMMAVTLREEFISY